jgi:hypothetical protein
LRLSFHIDWAELAGVESAMFVVKWIVRYKEKSPVETEAGIVSDLDDLVASCQGRLYAMRLRHVVAPPDGFIIADEEGVELRRWLGPIAREP